MTHTVKVLELGSPASAFLAEAPGLPGRFVFARTLPGLRAKLREAAADPGVSRVASFAWPGGVEGLAGSEIRLEP